MVRVFIIGQVDQLQSLVELYERLKEMVLDASLPNTDHYSL